MSPLMAQNEIEKRLREFPGWHQEGTRIVRRYNFSSFREAIDFVNRVADEAETIDHHPDITIIYNKVVLSIMTHNQGGITVRDFRLAGLIESLDQDVSSI